MAANSIMSSNSCYINLNNLLLPRHRSYPVGRRTLLLLRPVMTAGNPPPSPATPVDGTPPIFPSVPITPSRDQVHAQDEKLAAVMNMGLNFQLSSLIKAPTWAKFALGSIVLLSVPFLRRSLMTKDMMKKVENIADMVEATAEATEKVTEEIAGVLPEGSIKEAVLQLEKIALLVDKDIEVAEFVVDKVDNTLEGLESDMKKISERNQVKKDKIEGNVNTKIVGDQSKEGNNNI